MKKLSHKVIIYMYILSKQIYWQRRKKYLNPDSMVLKSAFNSVDSYKDYNNILIVIFKIFPKILKSTYFRSI